jgi:Protein of unknown function (DUF3301)
MIEAMILFVLTGACALFWQDALRARDRAVLAARQLCANAGVQLLDQSVSLKRLALVRRRSGGVGLRRQYSFEVSTNGSDRHRGSLYFEAGRLENFSLPLRADDPSLANIGRLH